MLEENFYLLFSYCYSNSIKLLILLNEIELNNSKVLHNLLLNKNFKSIILN